MARPFVKWVGGKTQLLPDLSKLVPALYGTYYEPFIGGGALFFKLEPKKAVLNDLNPQLTNLYIHIRDDLPELISELTDLQTDYIRLDHDGRKDFFYRQRELFNSLDDNTIRKSTLLIFLNRTCFNGIYRVNPTGKFNVPFGRNNHTCIFDPYVLQEASRTLNNVEILQGTYYEALSRAQGGDFIYLDPPYVPLTPTSNFTKYTGKVFGENEHTALRDTFIRLTNKGCKVMLSNSDMPLVRDLYKDFSITEVLASRSVNCKAHGRGKITELLVTNY